MDEIIINLTTSEFFCIPTNYQTLGHIKAGYEMDKAT